MRSDPWYLVQSCNRSGETGPVRPDRTGAGPDRWNWMDRPVFAGFRRSKEISKFTRGPPQGQVKNEFYNFLDIQFFHNKIRRETV